LVLQEVTGGHIACSRLPVTEHVFPDVPISIFIISSFRGFY
jgi:hypothetical protein